MEKLEVRLTLTALFFINLDIQVICCHCNQSLRKLKTTPTQYLDCFSFGLGSSGSPRLDPFLPQSVMYAVGQIGADSRRPVCMCV